jgi:hypothetical protein
MGKFSVDLFSRATKLYDHNRFHSRFNGKLIRSDMHETLDFGAFLYNPTQFHLKTTFSYLCLMVLGFVPIRATNTSSIKYILT